MTGHQAAQIAEDAARTLETLAVRIGAPDADNDALRNAARRHIHDLSISRPAFISFRATARWKVGHEGFPITRAHAVRKVHRRPQGGDGRSEGDDRGPGSGVAGRSVTGAEEEASRSELN